MDPLSHHVNKISYHLPPTQEVLKQHIKRARYQFIRWKKTLTATQELPDPANWGMEKEYYRLGTTMDHNFRSIPSMP